MSKESKDNKEIKATEIDPRIQQIAEHIKQLRIQAGYNSHENFAWDKGINRVQYWRIEKGSNITLQTLLKICDIHGITLGEFFQGFLG